jgi:hypothetical protein
MFLWLPRCRQLPTSYISLVSHLYISMVSMIHTCSPFFLIDVFVITAWVAAARTPIKFLGLLSDIAFHNVIVEFAVSGDIQDTDGIVFIVFWLPVIGIVIRYAYTKWTRAWKVRNHDAHFTVLLHPIRLCHDLATQSQDIRKVGEDVEFYAVLSVPTMNFKPASMEPVHEDVELLAGEIYFENLLMCFSELTMQGSFIVGRKVTEQFFVDRLQHAICGAEVYFGG